MLEKLLEPHPQCLRLYLLKCHRYSGTLPLYFCLNQINDNNSFAKRGVKLRNSCGVLYGSTMNAKLFPIQKICQIFSSHNSSVVAVADNSLKFY